MHFTFIEVEAFSLVRFPWVKVFSINTEFSIGKIFPQCIDIGKP